VHLLTVLVVLRQELHCGENIGQVRQRSREGKLFAPQAAKAVRQGLGRRRALLGQAASDNARPVR